MKVEIKADSINPNGERLVTMLAEYPRIIHAEHLRHRMFSFSVASSRAIPFTRQCLKVKENPFIPIMSLDQRGMEGDEEVPQEILEQAEMIMRRHAKECVRAAELLCNLGLHKQVVNRYLEPFINVSVLWSGTSQAWANFFDLRCTKQAEPHIRELAESCQQVIKDSEPDKLGWGEWHIPFADKMSDDLTLTDKLDISAARCARLSYETHDTKEINHEADLKLANSRLWPSKHMSPFEHQAQAFRDLNASGNLRNGWLQYRHSK